MSIKTTPYQPFGPTQKIEYQEMPLEEVEKLTFDDVLTHLVHCDDVYCVDYKEWYNLGIQKILRERFLDHEMEVVRCSSENRPYKECEALYDGISSRCNPILQGSLNHKRMEIGVDPMIGYDGLLYQHPFWFHGVGEIWRRLNTRSRRYTVNDCQRLYRAAEQCVASNDRSECFRMYSEAMACESGAHCPFLQESLIACMQRHSDINATFDDLNECYNLIPNFNECKVKSVPLTRQMIDELGNKLYLPDV